MQSLEDRSTTIAAQLTHELAAIEQRLRAIVATHQHAPGGPPNAWLHQADQQAAERANMYAQAADTPPMQYLASRLGVEASEQTVLWLLIAHEMSDVSRQLMRDLSTENTADATLSVLRTAAFGGTTTQAWDALGTHGRLQRFGLIERTDGGNDRVPLHRQTFKVAARVVDLALGNVRLDQTLAPVAQFHHVASGGSDFAPLAALTYAPGVVEYTDAMIAARDRTNALPQFAALIGAKGLGKRLLIGNLLRNHQRPWIEVNCSAVATLEASAVAATARALARECRLLDATPVLCNVDTLLPVGKRSSAVLDSLLVELATAQRDVFATGTRMPIVNEVNSLGAAIAIDCSEPTSQQRAGLWAKCLTLPDVDVDLLAELYPLPPSMMARVARTATAKAIASQQRDGNAIVIDAIADVVGDTFGDIAERVVITQNWNDIVLTDDQRNDVAELMARIVERQRVYQAWGFANKVGRGLGVIALFSGMPGTGKTMLAGMIAANVGLPIFRVDVSQISSKWIGETDKNLATLFDAAETSHAILLFDEADALFSKRTEVKSSNDHHANTTVSYLLQRLEAFKGICFLTTNHEKSIDEAFRRRISMHIRFALPLEEERLAMWLAAIPAAAPVAAIDFEKLAKRFAMSGGYIRNAVVRAAFLAAKDNSAITYDLLLIAAQREYEAMGHLAH